MSDTNQPLNSGVFPDIQKAVRDRLGVDLVPEVEDLGLSVTNRNAAASVESGR